MLYNLLLTSLFAAAAISTNIPTISYIDIDSYLGHWTQVYEAPTNSIFQGYGTCITADYGLLENGNVSVVNTQLDENNEIEEITGYAYYKNMSEPGKLTVHLEGVPVDSPYWIVKLGEVMENEYQYSIITTPSGVSLWVLARDLDRFFELYDEEVIEFLNSYNFRFVIVPQDNCDYN
jgi:lipocalin